jgi:hypothetical protein
MLSTLAFVSGLVAFLIMVAAIVFYMLFRNDTLSGDTLYTIARIMYPLEFYVLPIAGGAGIVLGIVSLVMAGKNPAISKGKAIAGICLSVIPLLFLIIGLSNMPG